MTQPTGASAPLLLGVDVGSSSTKALLLDPEWATVATSSVPTPFASTDGRVEMTVAGLIDALRLALEQLGDLRPRVAGVGIAGMAESGAPLDHHLQPLAPIIAWHDRRGEDVAERLLERFGDGLAENIGQRLRYVSTVAKLGWLVDHGLVGMERWLGVPELCLWALTGAEATECSLAARTGCRDVGRGAWITEVAQGAGFDPGVLADVVPAGEVMGRVTADAARGFGLPAGIPATVAGHDHLVGLAGSGATAEDLANSVGTAETVVARAPSLPNMAEALERGLAVTETPGGRSWAVLASAARSGPVLEAAAEALGHTLAELDRMAAGADLLEAPGLAESLRRREPPPLPDGPAGAVWNTLLHGLAAETVRAAVKVVGLVGPRSRLVVFGGGSASEPWLAAKAELSPLPVWRTAAGHTVARGAAIYAGTAAGWWPTASEAPPPPLLPV